MRFFKGMAAITIVASIGWMSGMAHAVTVVVDDDFEYESQTAFEAVWTPIGTAAPTSGILSTEQSASPTHSIHNPGVATNNHHRNLLTFPAVQAEAGEFVRWSFMYYDALPTGNPQRNYVNLQTSAAPGVSPVGQLISLGLNNNLLNTAGPGPRYMARVLGYDGGSGTSAYFKLDGGPGTERQLGWNELRVDIFENEMTFFINGIQAQTIPVGLLEYDRILLGSGLSNGSVEVFFDDMFLAVIPEPGMLSLLGLAGLGMLRRRRV